MHTVIETSDSGFQQHWNTLLNNDPLQDPLYKSFSQVVRDRAGERQGYKDRSFLIVAENQPVFGCSITLHMDRKGRKRLGYFGLDAYTHVNQTSLNNPSNNFSPESIQLLQQHIDYLLQQEQPETIDYYDPVSCGIMSPITQVLLGKGAQPTVQQVQLIDLKLSEQELMARMSSECRSNIRWGSSRLEIAVVRAQQSGDRKTELSLEHATEAARLKNYLELLNQGQGFLVQARCQKAMAASALFVHSNRTCQYVYADTMHQRYAWLAIEPLLQQIIWRGMLEGKKQGCEQFDFGFQHADSFSKHLTSIAPESFGGNVHTRLKVSLSASRCSTTH